VVSSSTPACNSRFVDKNDPATRHHSQKMLTRATGGLRGRVRREYLNWQRSLGWCACSPGRHREVVPDKDVDAEDEQEKEARPVQVDDTHVIALALVTRAACCARRSCAPWDFKNPRSISKPRVVYQSPAARQSSERRFVAAIRLASLSGWASRCERGLGFFVCGRPEFVKRTGIVR